MPAAADGPLGGIDARTAGRDPDEEERPAAAEVSGLAGSGARTAGRDPGVPLPPSGAGGLEGGAEREGGDEGAAGRRLSGSTITYPWQQ